MTDSSRIDSQSNAPDPSENLTLNTVDQPDGSDNNIDVTRVFLGDKEIILIGTAHISQQSVDLVEEVIDAEKPDVVAVELDDERYQALVEEKKWESLDLLEVIKKRQLLFLMARLALTAFQKRMGSYTGVKPGAEMAAAIAIAKDRDIEVVLVDRNVRTTLVRAWRKTPFWKRTAVAASLFAGVFEKNDISEEDLQELRQSQNLSTMLDEMGEILPSVKGVLVDERDTYMCHQIQNAPGKKIVVVIGAAHKPGMLKKIDHPIDEHTIDEITEIPPKSGFSKLIPWLIPLIVLSIFTVGFFYGDHEQLRTAAIAWVAVNGGLSALGTIIALGHPITILVAAIAAPLTSLNPTIGAGMVTAFVQTLVHPPTVRDMEHIGDDIVEWKGWWKNRLARIFLVFFFSSMGSAIGTFVAFKWLADLF